MEKLFRLTDQCVVKKTSTVYNPDDKSEPEYSNVSYELLSKHNENIQHKLKADGTYTDTHEDEYDMGLCIDDDYELLGCDVYENPDGILYIPFSSVSL